MSLALMFAGQGMQHGGMLPWLARDATVQCVEQSLGADWRARLDDPAWASCNAHAQLLLTGLSLAAWEQLAPLLPVPGVIAGYSVGELAAFAAAGVFDARTALALSRCRARCMDEAAAGTDTGLLAVSGLLPAPLSALCERFDLDVAIRNGCASVVVGGPSGALVQAQAAAEVQGARCTRLNVALASHTRWMQPAARAFEDLLKSVELHAPRVELCSNVQGRVRDAGQAREALARQIDHTVHWGECMNAIAARRVRCVLEIGPGQALARMWQQRYPDIPARSVDEFRSLASIVRWVQRALD